MGATAAWELQQRGSYSSAGTHTPFPPLLPRCCEPDYSSAGNAATWGERGQRGNAGGTRATGKRGTSKSAHFLIAGTRHTLMCSRCARGVLVVCSWCARGVLVAKKRSNFGTRAATLVRLNPAEPWRSLALAQQCASACIRTLYYGNIRLN